MNMNLQVMNRPWIWISSPWISSNMNQIYMNMNMNTGANSWTMINQMSYMNRRRVYPQENWNFSCEKNRMYIVISQPVIHPKEKKKVLLNFDCAASELSKSYIEEHTETYRHRATQRDTHTHTQTLNYTQIPYTPDKHRGRCLGRCFQTFRYLP